MSVTTPSPRTIRTRNTKRIVRRIAAEHMRTLAHQFDQQGDRNAYMEAHRIADRLDDEADA